MEVIIGIGDSWTVGEGSVPITDTDKKLKSEECIQLQNQKSWLAILQNKYYPGHHAINMARPGFSNRAAIKNLYFLNTDLKKQITGGYLIFLLSGWDRFSFVKTELQPHDAQKFRTVMATHSIDPIAKNYFELVHSENSCVAETMLAIIEAQNYAKLNNLKFLFANAFDSRGMLAFQKFPVLLDQIDVSRFLNNTTNPGYDSLNRFLYSIENNNNVVLHSPCFHPTAEGYRIIAEEIYKFMVKVG
jgi:lysophospholipase L1-like esterase